MCNCKDMNNVSVCNFYLFVNIIDDLFERIFCILLIYFWYKDVLL